MSIGSNLPSYAALDGAYKSFGSFRLVASTGAVTTIAARTATAGQLLVFRNPSATYKTIVKRIGAKFTLTTAYGTAQETGCDLILARAFSVNATDGTAVDVGSTVTTTNKLIKGQATSAIAAGCVRVASTAAITAGTHTLDANPIGVLSGWSAAIGDKVPLVTGGGADGFFPLFDAADTSHKMPLVFGQNEGFVVRNLILMGATGVGRWDFLVEWDEATTV